MHLLLQVAQSLDRRRFSRHRGPRRSRCWAGVVDCDDRQPEVIVSRRVGAAYAAVAAAVTATVAQVVLVGGAEGGRLVVICCWLATMMQLVIGVGTDVQVGGQVARFGTRHLKARR